MDPRDFLTVAGRLTLSQGSRAVDFRTAVSRAYYGAFHLARQFLNRELQFYCRDDNEHRWVQRHFYNCQLTAAKEIGRLLGNLHEARKAADYDLEDASIETLEQARFGLERAQQVQRCLDECSGPIQIETLRTEMTEYRSRVNMQ